MRVQLASLALVVTLVASCGASSVGPTVVAPTAYVSGPQPDTDVFGNSRVTVTATTKGVTQTFTVTSGRYDVPYLIDAGKDKGCTFALILTKSRDGPIVQSTESILPNRAEGAGDVTWTISAGQYLLQEDETGSLNCKRGFSATIRAQN
jgi:hypothetical protein